MKNLFLSKRGLYVIAIILVFSCKKNSETKFSGPAAVNASVNNRAGAAEIFNPFGVMVLASAAVDTGKDLSTPSRQKLLSAQNAVNLAVDYGVRYYRMQIYYDKWMSSTTRQGFLYCYSQANTAGLKVLLNVNWYYTDSVAKPFADAAAYTAYLKSVLDTLNAMQMKPELIVIENEEQNMNRHIFDMSSTTALHSSQQKYIDQLSSGTALCNDYVWWDGTVGIKVTNGGFTTRGITYNVWNWLKNETGDTTAARTFAINAFSPKVYADLYRKKLPSYLSTAIDMGNYYISAFQQIPMSVVNLHWYEPAKVRGWNMTKEQISP